MEVYHFCTMNIHIKYPPEMQKKIRVLFVFPDPLYYTKSSEQEKPLSIKNAGKKYGSHKGADHSD